eukprot:scaffold57479_cov45-Attheya_sp.AAC.2
MESIHGTGSGVPLALAPPPPPHLVAASAASSSRFHSPVLPLRSDRIPTLVGYDHDDRAVGVIIVVGSGATSRRVPKICGQHFVAYIVGYSLAVPLPP